MKIQIRECLDLSCHFRFPLSIEKQIVELCPRCNSATRVATEYQTERDSNYGKVPVAADGSVVAGENSAIDATVHLPNEANGIPVDVSFDCHVLLDNLRSLMNVGAIFRTGDGVGVSAIHLAGTSPTPEHPRLAKTALGTEQTMAWTYHANGLQAAMACKAEGRTLIALESGLRSRSIFEALPSIGSKSSLLVIVGNEVAGVDPEILDICDEVVALPMVGIKASLNVAVAFGIGIYQLRYGVKEE